MFKSKKYKYETVYELCPYCGEEHKYKISDGMVQKCKCCGKDIILCALCPNGYSGCETCKFKINNKEQENIVYEVNQLKENGEIKTSNSFINYDEAFNFYKVLGNIDKELLKNINDGEMFMELESNFVEEI